MPLAPGTKLGPYEVLSALGAGGMGEVYKARDTRLGREVAIKVSQERFSDRFEREARAVAALNHPNICTLHDVGPDYLVMELIQGSTLADRIAKGPVPLEEALAIARQIADALEAAHEKGIVHRDLKPVNVKVTADGVVKVLDFGLAKSLPSPADQEDCPTLTATQAGLIVGTPSYMSPEQAQGKPVGKRTDIWAFGVVLYEMLTGSRLFAAPTNTEVLAAVLTREPDLSRVPVLARRVLRCCLEKEPKRRLRDIGDCRLLLEEEPTTPAAKRRGVLPWLGAAALTVGLGLAVWGVWLTPHREERSLVRLNVDLGRDAVPETVLETKISPDGTRVAYVARSADGKQQLAIRRLDRSQTELLAGTENASSPVFSPDGQWIGFFADGKLKKVGSQGGAVVTVTNTDVRVLGASWGEDQNIVVARVIGPMQSVSANGGPLRPLLTKPGTRLGEKGDATHRWPQVLPGGRAVLFTSHKIVTGFDDAAIEAVVVATGERKTVLRGGYFGRYVASGADAGYLLYIREGALFAVPFNLNSLTIRGTPTPILDDVAGDSDSGAGQFEYGSGTLVYRSGKGPSRKWPILWLDSSGKTETLQATPGAYYTMRFSPDGKRLAMTVDHGEKGREIEVYDWQRGTQMRLTSTGEVTVFPVWSPDGKYIVFEASSPRGYGIGLVRGDGSGTMQRLGESSSLMIPYTFTPDGRQLIYSAAGTWRAPFDTSNPDHPKLGEPVRLPGLTGSPNLSPDGRWIAYRSEESGRSEVYVRPFPGPGAKFQVSIGGSGYTSVDWSPNGRELYYVGPDDRMMVVEYTVQGDTFLPGKPRVWSPTPTGITPFPRNFSMAPDGKRFAIIPTRVAATESGSVHVTFVLNFMEELRRRVK